MFKISTKVEIEFPLILETRLRPSASASSSSFVSHIQNLAASNGMLTWTQRLETG